MASPVGNTYSLVLNPDSNPSTGGLAICGFSTAGMVGSIAAYHVIRSLDIDEIGIDLLTIRALDRIKNADVLVWTDSLISPDIADLTTKNCEKFRTSSLTLEQILELLITKAKQGHKVVRLHDGDPCLYGAISEQICGLADEGLDVEIIPGISAYQATASELQKELTIPGVVQTNAHMNICLLYTSPSPRDATLSGMPSSA